MPNYCENITIFKHDDPATLERAKVAFLADGLFEEFIPCPKELDDSDDWCEEYWGTKWDVRTRGWERCGVLEEGPSFFKGAFLTAWSPPIEAFHALRKLGFEIEAFYLEEGMGFSGIYRFGHDYCDLDIPLDMLKLFGYDEANGRDDEDETDGGETALAWRQR